VGSGTQRPIDKREEKPVKHIHQFRYDDPIKQHREESVTYDTEIKYCRGLYSNFKRERREGYL